MQVFPSLADMGSPKVAAFHDKATGSWQYVASDPQTGEAVIVDPVLDFSPSAGATSTAAADEILGYVQAQGLSVAWIIDTHPHADHLSAAHYLSQKLGAPKAIGRKVLEVQDIWADLYADDSLRNRPEFWDRLLDEGDSVKLGRLRVEVLASPGHTLASISLRLGDAVFAHDTLMMPESGSVRADFPGGSAAVLWDSIQRLLALPGETRVFIGHDYGDAPSCMASVDEHRARNRHAREGISREDFVVVREARDRTLPLPDRMLMALQVNLRGGRLPEPDAQGRAILRVPLNRFEPPR